MAWLIAFIFSVGGIVIALASGAGWLWLRPGSRWARRWILGVATFYLFISVYPVPYGASRLLAHGYHRFSGPDVPTGRIAIVVLGFGGAAVRDWDGRLFPVVDRISMSRIIEAARVFRLAPQAWVISSGGRATERPGEQSTAEVMRSELVRLGVPGAQILLESESRTTHDEAVLVAPLLQSLQVDHVILVTSDTHMRRSRGAFASVGIATIPAVAYDPYPPLGWPSWVLPTEWGLGLASAILHELGGMLSYRARDVRRRLSGR